MQPEWGQSCKLLSLSYMIDSQKFHYICDAESGNIFEIRRKCLTSCEIANYNTKNIRGTETAHNCGLPIRAYIQVFGDTYKSARMAVHFFIYNPSKKISSILGCLRRKNSCKNRL